MIVRCKHCGAMNEKKPTDHKVTCKNCGKDTYYILRPGGVG